MLKLFEHGFVDYDINLQPLRGGTTKPSPRMPILGMRLLRSQ